MIFICNEKQRERERERERERARERETEREKKKGERDRDSGEEILHFMPLLVVLVNPHTNAYTRDS
jgi:hypothetical protein